MKAGIDSVTIGSVAGGRCRTFQTEVGMWTIEDVVKDRSENQAEGQGSDDQMSHSLKLPFHFPPGPSKVTHSLFSKEHNGQHLGRWLSHHAVSILILPARQFLRICEGVFCRCGGSSPVILVMVKDQGWTGSLGALLIYLSVSNTSWEKHSGSKPDLKVLGRALLIRAAPASAYLKLLYKQLQNSVTVNKGSC